MVVLKKVKAATLVETITASVIIIIVFTVASLILSNVFSNTIKNDKSKLNNQLHKLEYQYINGNITIPYHSDFEIWELSIVLLEEDLWSWIVFKAENKDTKKSTLKRMIYVGE